MLFDHLLEFFMPDNFAAKEQRERYRADAKYIFYLYSRYDRYWHYSLPERRGADGFPLISFVLPENDKDGVDHFGNLLRHHIHYCLPSHAQWLLPVLSHNKLEPPLAVLTTLLLAEGVQQIPARSRMTNRVQALLNSAEGKTILEKYERDFLDISRTKEHLEQWCKLLPDVPWEAEFVYEPGAHDRDMRSCQKYILEYSLKERMIQLARERLNTIAAQFFDSLCLGEYSYTTHPYID